MYLSNGGYLILIKSTLSKSPYLFWSLFPIPIAVTKRLKRIQRKFLSESLKDERKLHLVNRGAIRSPIRLGGLELRSLVLFNKVLLCKWL